MSLKHRIKHNIQVLRPRVQNTFTYTTNTITTTKTVCPCNLSASRPLSQKVNHLINTIHVVKVFETEKLCCTLDHFYPCGIPPTLIPLCIPVPLRAIEDIPAFQSSRNQKYLIEFVVSSDEVRTTLNETSADVTCDC
jgi:hypothetical protein